MRWLLGLLLCGMPYTAHAQAAAGANRTGVDRAGLEQTCPAGRAAPVILRQTQAALEANREIVIVTLGSSSTAGWHSTDLAHSYPAILQSELAARLPQSHVAVINRGIGGQDAADMVQRIERDVLDVHPTAVIWQVGANGAMRRANPEEFHRLVAAGVQRLLRAKVDVVLMDNQRAPKILASPEHDRIDQALQAVALQTGAGLFGRGALMDRWQAEGRPYADFISDDGIHHNDLGYRCLGRAVAQSILDGLALNTLTGSVLRAVRSASYLAGR